MMYWQPGNPQNIYLKSKILNHFYWSLIYFHFLLLPNFLKFSATLPKICIPVKSCVSCFILKSILLSESSVQFVVIVQKKTWAVPIWVLPPCSKASRHCSIIKERKTFHFEWVLFWNTTFSDFIFFRGIPNCQSIIQLQDGSKPPLKIPH